MAQSIKLGSNTFLDASGVSLAQKALDTFVCGTTSKSAQTVGSDSGNVAYFTIARAPGAMSLTRYGILFLCFSQTTGQASVGMVTLTYSNNAFSSIAVSTISGEFSASLDVPTQVLTVKGHPSSWSETCAIYNPKNLTVS